MDQTKTGALIRSLRVRAGLTQKQLAEQLIVSDKAVSKWETGGGCPDISMLTELASVLGTDVHTLLTGEIDKNESEVGNMKRIKFYVCSDCGNIITATSSANVTCCGRKLEALEPRNAADDEKLDMEALDGEWFVTSKHEMTKEHYISFAAYLSDSSAFVFKQYPEWNFQVRMPLFRTGELVWYCSKCGLLRQRIRYSPK